VKRNLSTEFVYQLAALLISVIVVHTLYVGLIRPNADAILEQQAALEAAGQAFGGGGPGLRTITLPLCDSQGL